MMEAVEQTSLACVPRLRRGKVRDVYDLGNMLLLVATDRVSAFDHVLATPIPDKGRVLTQLSKFWFEMTPDIVRNHLISTAISEFPSELQSERTSLEGRSMLVRKAQPVEVECVVRGFISGSAWKEYRTNGTVNREPFPEGLREFDRLPEPLFSPAVKRHEGHDENIPYRELEAMVGTELAGRLRDLSLRIYECGYAHSEKQGFLLADTKFEFGWEGDELILIDELFTPDSSRFWRRETYGEGRKPGSADKQIVRDYLLSIEWDGDPPVPGLPAEIVERVREQYLEIYRRIAGKEIPR